VQCGVIVKGQRNTVDMVIPYGGRSLHKLCSIYEQLKHGKDGVLQERRLTNDANMCEQMIHTAHVTQSSRGICHSQV